MPTTLNVHKKAITKNKERINELSDKLKENIHREPNCVRALFNKKNAMKVMFPPTLEKEYITSIETGLLKLNKELAHVSNKIQKLHNNFQKNVLRGFNNKVPFEEALKQRLNQLDNDIANNTAKLTSYKKGNTKIFYQIIGKTKKLKEKIKKDKAQLALLNSPERLSDLREQSTKLKEKFSVLNDKIQQLQKNLTPELANCVKPLLEHENQMVNKEINMLNTFNTLSLLEKSIEERTVKAVNPVIVQMDKDKNNETQKNSPSEQSLLKEKINEGRRGSNETNRSNSSTSLQRKNQQAKNNQQVEK